MYIIIGWTDHKHVAIITNENDEPLLFTSCTEATIYAMRNIAFKWQVIKLEG